jgi:MoxR-like ATPase
MATQLPTGFVPGPQALKAPPGAANAHPMAPPAPPAAPARLADDDLDAVQNLKAAHTAIRNELRKVIVGQEHVIDELLISIFTRSHALLVGVPGLAKTLLISSLAQTLHLSFKRVQFTPDLMPSDITGTEVIYQDPETNQRAFKFLKGPIFANIISPMRSTARPRRRRPRRSKRCRSGR